MTTGHCPECGAPLAAGGNCPHCLMQLGVAAQERWESAEEQLSVMPPPIGPYVPTELLGEGGMGLVYLAEQREPIRRRVALKLIKPGIDSREVIRRFEAERETLARMEHPGIARVLDAGTTERGNPFFVMEYVQGPSIVEYCDRERLGTRERLTLFGKVCDAVQHAHQKGIIHRDLKPSNVLVASNGEAHPKVIDFGVAKATEPTPDGRTTLTRRGQMVGTPAYMSPEQAAPAGFDVDTRSDVYSLGVMLYELLAGVLPFETDDGGVDELPRRIREEQPPRPSRRVSTLEGGASASAARNRRTDPGSLVRNLRGDLDWIVMKALEKERARRYQTPSDLAADIDRHLRHAPVSAGPPGAAYRLGKFVRRHRLGVAAGGVLALAVVLGAVGLTAGWVKASRSEIRALDAEARALTDAEEATQVSEFLMDLFAVSDPGESLGDTLSARDLLDRGAERIETELADQPAVQAAMMNTVAWSYRNLGLYDEAQTLLERALEIRERELPHDDPDLGDTLTKLGVMLAEDRASYDEGERLLRRAVEVYERSDPEGLSVADGYENLVSVYVVTGRYDDAAPLLERARRIREAHGDEDPLGLSENMKSMSHLYEATGRYEEALELQLRAVEIDEAILEPSHPGLASALQNLAIYYMWVGRYDEAEPVLQRSLEAMETAFGPDHERTGAVLANFGVLYFNLGRFDEGAAVTRRSLEIMRKTLGEDHPDYGLGLANLAGMELNRGDYETAASLLAEAVEITERALGPEHPGLASHLGNLAVAQRKLGALDRAEELQRRSLRIRESSLGPEHPDVAWNLFNLAVILMDRERPDEAEPLLDRALAIREESLGPDHVLVSDVLGGLARACRDQQRHDEARALAERAIEIRTVATPDHPEIGNLQAFLAELDETTE